MQGIHPWIHRSHLRIYLRPDYKALPGLPEPASKEPVTIDASGQEESEVERVLKDRIYRKKRQFLLHWKGYDEIKATWEPLDALEGGSTTLRTYWFDTYNETIPFHFPWTHNERSSAWTVQKPAHVPLSPELDPDGCWSPIQDSDYPKLKLVFPFPPLMKLSWKPNKNHIPFFYFFSVRENVTESTIITTMHCP